jgi:hypothetical protein
LRGKGGADGTAADMPSEDIVKRAVVPLTLISRSGIDLLQAKLNGWPAYGQGNACYVDKIKEKQVFISLLSRFCILAYFPVLTQTHSTSQPHTHNP